jgi:hypothetical protein
MGIKSIRRVCRYRIGFTDPYFFHVLFLFRINPENDPNTSISFMAKAILALELAPGF